MDILTDFSLEAVDTAVKNNGAEFYATLQEVEGVEAHLGEDMYRFAVAQVPHPIVNIVMKTHLDTDVEVTVKRVMSGYMERQLPFLWQLETSTRPGNLGDILTAHGMQSASIGRGFGCGYRDDASNRRR